jgi:hypothetical protein
MAAPLNRRQQRFQRRTTACLVILLAAVPALAALTHAYSPEAGLLSQQIANKAQQLASVTHQTAFNQLHAESILVELKNLITDYERTLVIAPTAYSGEFLLGATPPGDGTWLETLCDTSHGRLLKEIRIRRMGSAAIYLRISDIEITHLTPAGRAKYTLNRNARTKLYNDGVFKLALPRPMRVIRIRIKTSHKSNGLEVYGVPYQGPLIRAPILEKRRPGRILLGTTPPGDGAWLETICSVKDRRPIRQIRLTRTGTKAKYLRINDIEVTYVTPRGPMKKVFNKNGRVKLYYGGSYTLSLPRPMRIIRVRILTEHKSTGLNVYGVY